MNALEGQKKHDFVAEGKNGFEVSSPTEGSKHTLRILVLGKKMGASLYGDLR